MINVHFTNAKIRINSDKLNNSYYAMYAYQYKLGVLV